MVPAAPWRRSPPDSWLRRGSHQSPAQTRADPGVVKQEQQALGQAVPSVSPEQKEPSAPPQCDVEPAGDAGVACSGFPIAGFL